MQGKSLFINIVLVLLVLLFVFKKKLIKRKWLRGVLMSLAILGILYIIVFPGFSPLSTTGKHDVSVQEVELTDEHREESFLQDGSKRTFRILIYSPKDMEEKSPLVVFSHGGISTVESNLSLFRELASHGYVVVSIEHTYHALNSKIKGKSIGIDSGFRKELMEEDSHKDIQRSFELFKKWMKLRKDDIHYALEYLLRHADEYHIDNTRIALMGHSLGGSAVLGVAREREDIKALIILESPYLCDIKGIDGENFIWDTSEYSEAILNFYSDSGYPLLQTDHKYTQNKRLLHHKNVKNVYLKGSNHFTMTDFVRTSPVLSFVLGGGYHTFGFKTLREINERSLSFLETHLK